MENMEIKLNESELIANLVEAKSKAEWKNPWSVSSPAFLFRLRKFQTYDSSKNGRAE